MEELHLFLASHRRRLLARLDTLIASGLPGPDALPYVDEVLTCYARLSARARRSRPEPWERTFWFALYQLETLAEPETGPGVEAYRRVQIEYLRRVRDALRARQPLPDGSYASRPDEPYPLDELDPVLDADLIAELEAELDREAAAAADLQPDRGA